MSEEQMINDTEKDEISTEEKSTSNESSQVEQKVLSAETDDSDARWYVIHTYSGHEEKVKKNIQKLVESSGMQDLITEITVPMEKVLEVKNGQRRIKDRKLYPGYVIIKMIITDDSWYLVRNTQGVTGFVGHGATPVPLTVEEVCRMGIEKVAIELNVNLGDSVRVIGGPFEGFSGVVEEINAIKQVVKVRISTFRRDTPVELEFGQVDRI